MNLKKRLSCWLKKGKHTAKIDQRFNAQPHECRQWSIQQPSSAAQDHMVSITREVGRLRFDLSHFQTLFNEALMPLLPLTVSHCNGLLSAIQHCNEIIEQANVRRQLANDLNSAVN